VLPAQIISTIRDVYLPYLELLVLPSQIILQKGEIDMTCLEQERINSSLNAWHEIWLVSDSTTTIGSYTDMAEFIYIELGVNRPLSNKGD
jgi:hypothetical protein